MNAQPVTADPDTNSTVQIPPMSPTQTRELFLGWTGRGYSVDRFILVQKPDRDKDRVSTVGVMTRERHQRALVLYLMLLTWWPWLEGRRDPLDSEVWLRALTAEGPNTAGALTWSASTLSRTWGELEKYGLIKRRREGRLTRIIPCREDGEDREHDYVAPAGEKKDRLNTYFTIPGEFWTEQYFATLSPAALGVLLIVLKETTQQPDIELPREKMTAWYGISGKTVTKGINELTTRGLMAEPRIETRVDPAAKYGYTRHFHYGLTGPFSPEARREQQELAKKMWQKKKRKKDREKAKLLAAEVKS